MFFNWQYFAILFAFVGVFYLLKTPHKQLILLLFSIGTILFWSPFSLGISIISTLLTYWCVKQNNSTLNHVLIILFVLGLFLFNIDFQWFEGDNSKRLSLIGYSYFTLLNSSVLLERKSNFSFNELLYANLLFPKYISGPIYMLSDMKQLTQFSPTISENIAAGVNRILFGLAKKLILANRLNTYVNNLLFTEHANESFFNLAVAGFLFTLEMYLDFSAYTDIAIGSARLFGIDLKENFNLPLRSKTITEYWRKTHISLIAWLSKYVYYPITYSFRKQTVFGVIAAIGLTFFISGVWHGWKIGFIIWGLLNAIYLIFEFLNRKFWQIKLNNWGIIVTLVLISFSNLFFKLSSIEKLTLALQKWSHAMIFPVDFMSDFIAILGNGGHLLQQYNLAESFLLLVLFFVFERFLEQKAKSKEFSFIFLFLTGLSIFFLGNFNVGTEFIYVQF